MTLLWLLSVAVWMIDISQAVSSCSDCNDGPCLLTNPATTLDPGAKSIAITICQYDSNREYEIEFVPDHIPSCDQNQMTKPVQATLQAQDGCSAAACTFDVVFVDPIDSAIALKYNSGETKNVLKARFAGSDNDELIRVAEFTANSSPSIIESQDLVSSCADFITFSSLHFSVVPECNSATICMATENSLDCKRTLASETSVALEECREGFCHGAVHLENPLRCQMATNDQPFLISTLKVGDSEWSGYTKTSRISKISAEIESVAGLEAGGDGFTMIGRNFCPDGSLEVSTQTDIELPNIESMTSLNATALNVRLSKPIDFASVSLAYTFQMKTCFRDSNQVKERVTGAEPTIEEKNVLFKVGDRIDLDVKGTGFSFIPSQLNVSLQQDSNNVSLPSISVVKSSDQLLTLDSADGIPKDTPAGTRIVLNVAISSSGLSAAPQQIGTVCDDVEVSCEGGDNRREGDPSTQGGVYSQDEDNTTGIGTGLYAAIGIGVVATVGLMVEFKMHRKRQKETDYIDTI